MLSKTGANGACLISVCITTFPQVVLSRFTFYRLMPGKSCAEDCHWGTILSGSLLSAVTFVICCQTVKGVCKTLTETWPQRLWICNVFWPCWTLRGTFQGHNTVHNNFELWRPLRFPLEDHPRSQYWLSTADVFAAKWTKVLAKFVFALKNLSC